MSCYHCGAPLGATACRASLGGRERDFCCAGCQEVSRAIVAAGLGDYYRHRDRPAPTGPSSEHLREVLGRLELYDHPQVQESFVRHSGPVSEAQLLLEELRCPACLWLNERRLRQLDGVLDVSFDYEGQRAEVRWDPARIRLSEILAAIAALGYVAHPYDPSHRRQLAEEQKRRSVERLVFAALVGMLVMQLALAEYVMGPAEGEALPLWVVLGRWTALAATITILAYPAQDFFFGAWRDLRNRRLGMDVPVSVALSLAFLGSAWATVTQQGEVYFDSVAMFATFLLFARYWELRGRLAAAGELDRLARVIPRTARRLAPAGEEWVPVVALAPGDRVRVLPGETVPADGVIVEGRSHFDESVLTGESRALSRVPGEAVIGGSCNGEQAVVIEVRRPTGQSVLSQIQALLRRAARERPDYAVLAQRAAGYFVAAVLVVATGTASLWLWLDPAVALRNTLAVLIVTCPCALSLAAPVAMAVSAGRFSRLGLLPARMGALEALAQSEVAVFDKTGTLTHGRPRLGAVRCVGRLDREQALAHAAGLEATSSHVLAGAFRAPDPTAFERCETVPGQGMRGELHGNTWVLGSPELAAALTPLGGEVRRAIEELRRDGATVVALADASGVQALFALEDALRSGATELVAALRAQGLRRLVLLSGDAPESVARVAGEAGIAEWRARMSAEDKLAWIRRVQASGQRVLMVGDGVNDAPTLAGADVSLSFAGATELAQINSDFVVLSEELSGVAAARALARRTRRIIFQNLAWAGSYNFLTVPAAAMGLIPPWGAAIGMTLSSLLVIGNALRLRHPPSPATSGPVPAPDPPAARSAARA